MTYLLLFTKWSLDLFIGFLCSNSSPMILETEATHLASSKDGYGVPSWPLPQEPLHLADDWAFAPS